VASALIGRGKETKEDRSVRMGEQTPFHFMQGFEYVSFDFAG
jgi:hypothetical protein